MVRAISRATAILSVVDRDGKSYGLDMVKGASLREIRDSAAKLAEFCDIPFEDQGPVQEGEAAPQEEPTESVESPRFADMAEPPPATEPRPAVDPPSAADRPPGTDPPPAAEPPHGGRAVIGDRSASPRRPAATRKIPRSPAEGAVWQPVAQHRLHSNGDASRAGCVAPRSARVASPRASPPSVRRRVPRAATPRREARPRGRCRRGGS